jgi:hypothetical protein
LQQRRALACRERTEDIVVVRMHGQADGPCRVFVPSVRASVGGESLPLHAIARAQKN